MENSLPAIYVDACALIDAVKFEVGALPTERNNDAWHLKKLMEAHAANEVRLYTSFLSVAECVSIEPGQTQVPTDVQEKFRTLLLSGQYLRLVAPSPRIATMSQDIRWKYNVVLKGADALHVATALEQGCFEFITTDERIQKIKMKDTKGVLAGKRLRLIAAGSTALLPDHYTRANFLGSPDVGKKQKRHK
jgi:predicted nucleic acid-binding protein